ncbi:unnamed protein product [Discosporangium mesarthrocarpum]
MAASLVVVSVETPDSSPSVMICTKRERYLFNVGEGTQRLCMEHKIRLTKTENVFLTHICADTVGGLPGMQKTGLDIAHEDLQWMPECTGTGRKESPPDDFPAVGQQTVPPPGGTSWESGWSYTVKAGSMTLHGPPGVKAFHRATRHFMKRPEFCVQFQEYLLVTKLAIRSASTGNPSHRSQDRRSVCQDGDGDGDDSVPEPLSKRARPDDTVSATAVEGGGAAGQGLGGEWCVCYACETPVVAGKLDAEKATALGIPKGPLLGMLKKGTAVTLPGGKVIQPAEASLGSTVLIVACPTPDFLPALVSHPGWERFHNPPRAGEGGGGSGSGPEAAGGGGGSCV